MLILDNLLLWPMRGLLGIFREIQKAAEQEFENEGEAIRSELRELYMRMETQQITEAEFDTAETVLLDRLDRLEPRAAETDHEIRTEH